MAEYRVIKSAHVQEYRVCRVEKLPDGSFCFVNGIFEITPIGATIPELQNNFKEMLKAFDRPVLSWSNNGLPYGALVEILTQE